VLPRQPGRTPAGAGCLTAAPAGGGTRPAPNPPPNHPPPHQPNLPLARRFEGAEAAWDIIKKGPEPLTSQFAASYGLVLNLLSVYSLEAARQFLAKSFGTFLNLEGTRRKLQVRGCVWVGGVGLGWGLRFGLGC
jgi:hypothetical protein